MSGALRLGDPELEALHLAPVAAGSLLGMRDTAPRGHEIELPRPDDLLRTEELSRWRTSPRTSQVTVCRPMCGWGPTPTPVVPSTPAGPMWSAKHQAPTVRRRRRGRARRTVNRPTGASRSSVTSTFGPSGPVAVSEMGASRLPTGPLTGSV